MSGRARALLLLVFGAAVIGFAPILARLTETGPAAGAFWRLVFAAPLLGGLALRSGGGGERLGTRANRWAVGAGVLFALDLGFWHYGLAYTSVANATVLTNLTPVVVTIAAWLLLRERPRRLFVAALALAVAGATAIALAKGSGGRGTNPPLGDALSMVTALWYGGYFLMMRRGREAFTASSLMFWAGLAGAPLLLGAALLLGEEVRPAGWGGWLACAGLGLVHVAGQGSIAWSLGRLPAALAAVTVLVQPVVAAAVGWWLFAERVSPAQAGGAALLLAGVVLAQVSSLRNAGRERGGGSEDPPPAQKLAEEA